MVITIDSGTWALIYELALIGLDWVSKNGPMSNSAMSVNMWDYS